MIMDSTSLPIAIHGGKTLAEHAEELYVRYESLQSSPHTLARQRSAMRVFIDFMENNLHVTTAVALQVEHIHAFQNHLAQKVTVQGLPLKPATINTIIKAVRPSSIFSPTMVISSGHWQNT
jgi:hypothetical protein